MNKGKILESWKEISIYLGRSVRTCQIWEREMALPVHRLDGSPKARVFAYKDELDRWLEEKLGERASGRGQEQKKLSFKPKRLVIILVVMGGIFVVALVGWKMRGRAGHAFLRPTRPTIAVVRFENQTGDEVYDNLSEVIPNLIITKIENTGLFEVTTWERMQDVAAQMGKLNMRFIDPELGFDICRRDNIGILVAGSFTKAGDTVVTELKAFDVSDKKLLKSASSRGEGIESILTSQIDDLCSEVFRWAEHEYHLTEVLPAAISEVTTNSLEAYEYYLQGKSAFLEFQYEDACENLEKATELDAAFASAYLYLARAYMALGNIRSRDSCLRKAKNCISKASDKESRFIEYEFSMRIENDPRQGIHVLEQAGRKYPNEKEIHFWLGYEYQFQHLSKAVDELKKAIQLDPEFSYAWNQLGFTYGLLAQYQEAEKCIRRYIELCPGQPNPWDTLGWIYFLARKPEEAIVCSNKALQIKPDFHLSLEFAPYVNAYLEKYDDTMKGIDQYVELASSSGLKMQAYFWKGFYCFWLGMYEQSINCLERAEDLAEAVGWESSICDVEWLMANIYLESVKIENARQLATTWFEKAALLHYEDVEIYEALHEYMMSMIELREGEIKPARARLAAIEKVIRKVGDHPSVYVIPHLKCLGDYLKTEILLASGSPNEVISMMKIKESQNPIYYHSLDFSLRYNEPFMRDSLARGYKKLGDLDKAVSEYERLISLDSKDRDRRLIHPKLHYRLAKLYEERGDISKAEAEYKLFLDLWKDADPGLPEVEDAKTRLAGILGEDIPGRIPSGRDGAMSVSLR